MKTRGSGVMVQAIGLVIVFLTTACGARTAPLAGDVLPVLFDGGDAAFDDGSAAPFSDATTPELEAGDDASFDAPTAAAAGPADADAMAATDSGCGPDTCTGCCRKDGSCVDSADETAAFCGSGGLECITCPPGIACGIDTSDGTRVCAHFL